MDGIISRKRKGGPSYNPRGGARRRVMQQAAYRRLIPASQRGYSQSTGYFGRFNLGGAYSRLRRNPFVRRSEVEKKYFDTLISAQAITASWVVSNSQNLIAQGTTESTRIGRKIVVKDIHCNGQVVLSPDDDITTPSNQKVRVMLMLDTQANGANPTASGATGVMLDTDVNSFHALANKGRFRTLYECEEVLVSQAGAGDGVAGANDFGGDIKKLEFHKKVNIPIEYDSTTGAITEIRSNNLFWIFAGVTTGSTFTVRTRLRFTDM